MARIFIGCVTYGKDAYALPLLLMSLKQFSFHDWSLHFIDTTESTAPQLAPYRPQLEQEIKNRLPGRSYTITKYAPQRAGEPTFEVISRARNALREQFLQTDCTHLLFIDDDMAFPPETLPLLLSHRAPVAAGVYINNLDLGEHGVRPLPVAYISTGETTCKPLTIVDVLPPRLIKVAITGFGCALIERKVLEEVQIAYTPGATTTEDTPFYLELERRGVPVLLDTRVKCKHFKYPLGDPRNRALDFLNYEVRIKQK